MVRIILIMFIFLSSMPHSVFAEKMSQLSKAESYEQENILNNDLLFVCIYIALAHIPTYVTEFTIGEGYPVTSQERAIRHQFQLKRNGMWTATNLFDKNSRFMVERKKDFLRIWLPTGESREVDMKNFFESTKVENIRALKSIPSKKTIHTVHSNIYPALTLDQLKPGYNRLSIGSMLIGAVVVQWKDPLIDEKIRQLK